MTSEVEAALLARLKAHQSATVDDLLDSLPNEEIRLFLAAFGRKAVRITQAVNERKAPKPAALGAIR